MTSMRLKHLVCLLVGLFLLVSCASVSTTGQGTTQANTPQAGTPSAVPPTATATVDPSNVSQLLALAHEKGPQDVTYTYSSTVKSPQGSATGTGKAIFTRTPQRFLLDIQFPTAPILSRHQVYDYTTKKLTTTSNGTTRSSTSNIEPYYMLHNGKYLGKETVNGQTAYHYSGLLYQDTLGVPTELWIRVSDLYVVKVTQHAESQGITDDLAYTDPVFNTGATIPAP